MSELKPDDKIILTVKQFEENYVSRVSYDALRARVAELEQANMNYAVNICPEQDRIIAALQAEVSRLKFAQTGHW